eukprot:379805-Prymnesium_polylepis.1
MLLGRAVREDQGGPTTRTGQCDVVRRDAREHAGKVPQGRSDGGVTVSPPRLKSGCMHARPSFPPAHERTNCSFPHSDAACAGGYWPDARISSNR